LAVAVPLAFCLVTHQVWEDCLITLRHSRNFVEGNGLVFSPGRKIQGFTSCLNVMLLAATYALSGRSTDLAIDFYRVICLAAFVAGGWILLRMMLREPNRDRLSPLVFILMYATEAKTVAFTMNGQESALMVMFLATGFYAIYNGAGAQWKILALSWTGLLYTRPDAPVFVLALAIGGLVFGSEDRRVALRGMLKACVTAAVLFTPWFLAMWAYYGNPIPNTVFAKSGANPGTILSPFGTLRDILAKFPSMSPTAFDPVNSFFGGWPRPLLDTYDFVCWIICVSYWLIPSGDRMGRMASLLFVAVAFYFAFVAQVGSVSAWYVPSLTTFSTLVLGRVIWQWVRAVPGLRERPMIWTRAIQGGIVMVSMLVMIGETYEMYFQETLIEDSCRHPLGLYLHDVVAPGQIIYLEPLGYTGYYSQRLIYDFPGLVSPEVVHIHHDDRLDQIHVVTELKPDWIVFRGGELRAALSIPLVANGYTTVRTFDVRQKLDDAGYIPGKAWLYIDSTFYVLRRLDVTPASNTSISPYGS
jgi:hypothetical protein